MYSRNNPITFIFEVDVSSITIAAIVIWVVIVRAKKGAGGVRRIGYFCTASGLGGGGLFGFTSELATCAGLGVFILATINIYPPLWGARDKK